MNNFRGHNRNDEEGNRITNLFCTFAFRGLSMGFLGVRVFEGKRGEWGRGRNVELGAMVECEVGRGRRSIVVELMSDHWK